MSARVTLSPPFASREFNGEVLLDELADLRDAQVAQQPLNDCAEALREFSTLRASEAVQRMKHLASARFQSQPALAALLVRWANRVKSEQDVAQLSLHFQRLALTAGVIAAFRRSGFKGRRA